MKFSSRILTLGVASFLLCTVSLLCGTESAAAWQQQPAILQAPAKTSITIMVLDMSGSMREHDPQNSRCSAVNAFIDMSGPSNFIGVVGLDGSETQTGGAHNFALAQDWAKPREMSTLDQRRELQNAIKQASNNCTPNGFTPTYDALQKALTMLQEAAKGPDVDGSVILLTDGNPQPRPVEQVQKIKDDLLPQFKEHGWAINTIALGNDEEIGAGSPFRTFREFLNSIADATNGKFYDNTSSVIQGQTSPLNIAPFFVDIFARSSGRTPGDDIGVTALNQTVSRNFAVSDYTDTLDVIVVKDQAGTTATLQDATGRDVTQQAGVFISKDDPYYVFYSISQPQSGLWTLNVTGSGQFLMKSLKQSSLKFAPLTISQANLAVSKEPVLALGQTITISTSLLYQDQPVTNEAFAVTGLVSYKGTSEKYNQNFTLDGQQKPGTYIGNITIPETAPPGSYEIVINAGAVSLSIPISSISHSVRIERFPTPQLISPQTQKPSDQIQVEVVRWNPLLEFLYRWPGPSQWLGQYALQNYPASPQAVIQGLVTLNQQPYDRATIKAEVNLTGSKQKVEVLVVNDGQGRFHIVMPVTVKGSYVVTFHTSGDFKDSHGDFGVSQRQIQVNMVDAGSMEARAWLLTGLYLLLLLFILNEGRIRLLARPFGSWVSSQAEEVTGNMLFSRASRGSGRFLTPNRLNSERARMPKGLRLLFRRGNSIQVKPLGAYGAYWRKSDGTALSPVYQEIRELRYQPGGDHDEDTAAITYKIDTQKSDHRMLREDDEDIYLGSSRRNQHTYDDVAEKSSGRGRSKSKRSRDEYEDW